MTRQIKIQPISSITLILDLYFDCFSIVNLQICKAFHNAKPKHQQQIDPTHSTARIVAQLRPEMQRRIVDHHGFIVPDCLDAGYE